MIYHLPPCRSSPISPSSGVGCALDGVQDPNFAVLAAVKAREIELSDADIFRMASMLVPSFVRMPVLHG